MKTSPRTISKCTSQIFSLKTSSYSWLRLTSNSATILIFAKKQKNSYLVANGTWVIFSRCSGLLFRWRSTSTFLILVPPIRIPLTSVILEGFVQICRPFGRQSHFPQRKQLIGGVGYQILFDFDLIICSKRFVGRIYILIRIIRIVVNWKMRDLILQKSPCFRQFKLFIPLSDMVFKHRVWILRSFSLDIDRKLMKFRRKEIYS